MNKNSLATIILFHFLFNAFLFSQTREVSDTLRINLKNYYKISELNIIPFSEKVLLRNRTLNRSEYEADYSSGTFKILQHVTYSLLDTLIITYKSVKINLKQEYKHRNLEIHLDEKTLDTLRIAKPSRNILNTESIFGKDLQRSGALVRGFTIGTNRDFTLNSGLRLQLTGRLSDDIDIVAALSDENTPIQPEGNTETLEELDKVFIELKHRNAVGTFGDYEFNVRNSEFAQITRKLQGLQGEILFENTKGKIAVAGSRGKYNSNLLQGQDGNQGPYRLTGANNERAIFVIAGSEKVFVDGAAMKRGENNDYVIDYSNAEVTFTAKKLITSASRITIEFEYTDQKFKRNFFGADFKTMLMSNKLKVGVSYFQEGDDENSPIDFSYTDEQLEILKHAGNDRNKAIVSGVTVAGLDSLGKTQGIYLKADTTIYGKNFSYYRYFPKNTQAIYNVTFSFVGEGNGDYSKESLGRYKFAGIKSGSYLPIIYIPMPEQKRLGNLSLDYNLSKGVSLNAELSASSWDQNKISDFHDAKNFGYARKLNFNFETQEVSLAGVSLGKIGLSYKDRFIESRYSSLDRIDDVEFNRNYNISSSGGDQTLREIRLQLEPTQNLNLTSKYGYLKQGESFQSDRLLNHLKFSIPKTLTANYTFDYVAANNKLTESKWVRQNSNVNILFGEFSAGLDFLNEDKKEKLAGLDSLSATSLRYLEFSPFVQYTSSASFDVKANVGYREESFPLKGKLEKQSSAFTQQYQVNYRGTKEFTTSINLTLRNKTYTEVFKNLGYGNNETILLLSQSRINLFNNFLNGELYYQAATEQSARMEKVFVKVPVGTGNYIYLGDRNNNGIPEESEFQLSLYEADFVLVTIPTDKLFPVIDLKTNIRWKLDFSRLVEGDGMFHKIVKAFSTETFWRVEENSKDKETKNIYLLNFSKFLNETNTLRGTNYFQKDVNILQNNKELSFRLRYNQRKSLNQYSGGVERGYLRERSLRIRFKMVEEINNQTDFINQTDNMISPVSTSRAREINKNSFVSDFSYRPIREMEVGFKFEAARSLDQYPAKPSTVDMNSFVLRSTYSFENSGRLRVEVERTELTSSSVEYNIPFEVLRGNVIGKNYFWRAFFDFRVSSLLQTSVSYDARKLGGSRIIHTMRAEAKAYF
ncbi:MAG: hypothetical protein FD143_1331 [Ignavibacteria bacterium]|nr:MAG: hypothetical protein FD143_1331 [Ignavibacteria bacterium]KAF0160637.1 MAG: hypothetical protein FD188_1544 [Ignavibacteria bacterium]